MGTHASKVVVNRLTFHALTHAIALDLGASMIKLNEHLIFSDRFSHKGSNAHGLCIHNRQLKFYKAYHLVLMVSLSQGATTNMYNVLPHILFRVYNGLATVQCFMVILACKS